MGLDSDQVFGVGLIPEFDHLFFGLAYVLTGLLNEIRGALNHVLRRFETCPETIRIIS